MKKSKQKTHIKDVIFFDLEIFEDERGSLTELFRSDCLNPPNTPVMAYFSETKPGVMRGPHEHLDQSDYFCFIGPANFELYLWEKTGEEIYKETHLVGKDNPVAVIVPPGVVHAYKNVSEISGLVFNGPNRLYGGYGKCYDVDEIRHELNKNCPYV